MQIESYAEATGWQDVARNPIKNRSFVAAAVLWEESARDWSSKNVDCFGLLCCLDNVCDFVCLQPYWVLIPAPWTAWSSSCTLSSISTVGYKLRSFIVALALEPVISKSHSLWMFVKAIVRGHLILRTWLLLFIQFLFCCNNASVKFWRCHILQFVTYICCKRLWPTIVHFYGFLQGFLSSKFHQVGGKFAGRRSFCKRCLHILQEKKKQMILLCVSQLKHKMGGSEVVVTNRLLEDCLHKRATFLSNEKFYLQTEEKSWEIVLAQMQSLTLIQ